MPNRRTPTRTGTCSVRRPDASYTSSVRSYRCGSSALHSRGLSMRTTSSSSPVSCPAPAILASTWPSPARATRTRTVASERSSATSVTTRTSSTCTVGPAVQDDVPEQAREPEEVLVLDPRPGAPPDHLRHDDVLAVDQGVGEVELRRGEGVRPVAHVGAVQPDGDGALRTVEAARSAARRARAGARGRTSDGRSPRGCTAGEPAPARPARSRPTGTARWCTAGGRSRAAARGPAPARRPSRSRRRPPARSRGRRGRGSSRSAASTAR